jgi:radical SAM superfamily enzyme YgiQ (UPF0313 family)
MISRPFRILLLDPVYGAHTPFWYVPLGMGYLASYLGRVFGSEVHCDIERELPQIVSLLKSRQYDLIATSNYVWNTAVSYDLLCRARQTNAEVITVQGGPHFQHIEFEVARRYFQHHPKVDYYVHGEGESTFALLVEHFLAGTRPHKRIPGLAYLQDGEFLCGDRRERIKDLDDIPSPYLSGHLDRFLQRGMTPILETNRGCPFSCTFCNWGSATLARVHKFSFERVRDELSYIAREVRNNDHLTVADANFGILPRDLNIAEHIEWLWREYGYPGHMHLWYAKNSSSRVIDIANTLGTKVRYLLAVQSLDSQVLANIKRSNIKSGDYQRLADAAHSKGLLTASDLIIGLPGDTLQSFKAGLRTLHEQGSDKVDMYNLILIPGTELATQESRERFGMQTGFRLADGCFANIDGDIVVESEEIVISTSTFSHDDFRTLRYYKSLVHFWHHAGLGDPVSQYAKTYGILEPDLFFEVLQNADMSNGFRQSIDFLQTLVHAEIYRSHEALLASALENFDKLKKVTRLDFVYAYHLIQTGRALDLIEVVLNTLQQMICCNGAKTKELKTELATLRHFTAAFQRALDTNQVAYATLFHDLTAWLKTKCIEPLSDFVLPHAHDYVFERNRTILPKEDLSTIDPRTCDPDRFNHWYDRIRNVRNYVNIWPCT